MGHIRYEVDGGIATITIDRPEKRNAMTYAVLRDFTEAVRRAGDDEDARGVIVTGAGGAFCAGTDLTDLDDTPTDERGIRGRSDDRQAVESWPLALRECFSSEDHAEGVASFLERRPARFTGR